MIFVDNLSKKTEKKPGHCLVKMYYIYKLPLPLSSQTWHYEFFWFWKQPFKKSSKKLPNWRYLMIIFKSSAAHLEIFKSKHSNYSYVILMMTAFETNIVHNGKLWCIEIDKCFTWNVSGSKRLAKNNVVNFFLINPNQY